MCDKPGVESSRPDNTLSKINRRQYLSIAAITGATSIVPSVAADDRGTGEGELFRETVDDGGATATVSETGEIIAFGVYAGTVRAYIADGDEYNAVEFTLPGVSPGFAVSHVIVTEETNNIVAATMDDEIIGGGDLDDASSWFGTPGTDAEWAYEQPGLWDISASADLSTVAAVSAPMEVTPHIAVVQDGEIAWEQPLDDAAARSVDVSDDGQYIAVGCVHIDEGLDRTGQPGVLVYSGDGELLWSHETVEDVLNIGVNVDAGIVAAGVDFGSTLVFDLEGNSLWQRDDLPTMMALSGDGSTIIADPPITAFDSSENSVHWESDIHDANVLADPLSVSDSGDRVAVSTFDFELFVLENGELIWEDENEAGPYYSAISDDGTTLASMEVDNDAQNAELVGYRL